MEELAETSARVSIGVGDDALVDLGVGIGIGLGVGVHLHCRIHQHKAPHASFQEGDFPRL